MNSQIVSCQLLSITEIYSSALSFNCFIKLAVSLLKLYNMFEKIMKVKLIAF